MSIPARRLGMFPLSTVLFPHITLPLQVFEERYLALVADCLEGERELGVVLIARGSEVGGGDQRVAVGTAARIVQVSSAPGNRLLMVVRGVRRIRVLEWLPDDPYPCALVEDVPTLPVTGHAPAVGPAAVAVRRVRALLSELGQAPALPHDLAGEGTGEEVGWRLCSAAPLNLMDSQQLLQTDDLGVRMALLSELCDAMAQDITGMLAGGFGQ